MQPGILEGLFPFLLADAFSCDAANATLANSQHAGKCSGKRGALVTFTALISISALKKTRFVRDIWGLVMFCGNTDRCPSRRSFCLEMKTNLGSGYLGLHSYPSTRSGTVTDRSTEVQNEIPTKPQLADQGDLLFLI